MYVIHKCSIRTSQRTHCTSTGKKINLFKPYKNIITVRCGNHKVEVNFTIKQATKVRGGGYRYRATLSLTSALDVVGSQRHAPAALPPGKRPGIYCIGGWLGPRIGLDGCGKTRLHRNSIPDLPARSQSLYRLSYPGPSVKIMINT